MGQTRGQILMAKLAARDGGYEYTPDSPALKIVEAEDHGVGAFIQKYEATRPPKDKMPATKQAIWESIVAAAKVTLVKDEDGNTPTTEQATSAYLEQNPDEYRAWQQAPWAEAVMKSEDANSAEYHLTAAVKKLRAERKAGLERIAADMKSEADAHTAAKAAKGR